MNPQATPVQVSCPEERQKKIIWEFQALDGKRTGRIKPADALFLFKSVMGGHFSLATWYAFVCDRGSSSADVTMGEIEDFLLAEPPPGHPATLDDYLSTEEELRRKRTQREYKKYAAMTAGRRESVTDSDQRQYTHVEQKAEQRVLALENEGLGAIETWLAATPDTGSSNEVIDQKLWEQVYGGQQGSSPQRTALEKAIFHGNPFQRCRASANDT